MAIALHTLGRFPMVNTRVLVFQLGRTLVDAGPSNQWRQLRKIVERERIERCVLSHAHEDHSGCAAALKAHGVQVLAPEASLPLLGAPEPIELYRRVFFGSSPPVEAEPMPAEGVHVPGFGALRAVSTPGHSPDHACLLLEERGVLFGADAFVTAKPTLYRGSDQCARNEIASLRATLRLDFDTVYCSHRGLLADGRAALAARLAWLEEVQQRTREMRAEGRAYDDIATAVLGPPAPFNFLMERATCYSFSRRSLLQSLVEECAYCSP